MTRLAKSVEFTEDFRCFKAGEKFQLRAGINLLVGEQGCGKSTFLVCLRKSEKCRVRADKDAGIRSFDFEKDNLRSQPGFDDRIDYMAQLSMRWSSHGETNRAILRATKKFKDVLIVQDEPDQALSIRSCVDLLLTFRTAVANGCQVVASVHNPVVILGVDEVLSLEHRKWMSSAEFVKNHGWQPPT